MVNDIQITLLTSEEYNKYRNIIPVINDWWWCKDACPGYHRFVRCVCSDGALNNNNCNINYGVRPVLKLNLSNLKSLNPGDYIQIGSKGFTILSWDEFRLIALCDEFIATRRFDPDNSDWERSELKEWLETEGLKLIF